jgi:glycosyltransferase involved in cell wall biosynthesis
MMNNSSPQFRADLVTGATRGLLNDAEIVATALANDFRSTFHVARERNLYLSHRQLPRAIGAWCGFKRLTVMFQIVPPVWYRISDSTVLIPNQEYLGREVFDRVSHCREVWCKTRYAEALLKRERFAVRYIGFTGKDILQPDISTDYSRCIHVAGRSHLKGTRQLLSAWQRHPEWPELLVVTQQQAFLNYVAPNIRFMVNYLSDRDLHWLMNSYGIHLCISETEGFGHYISEAMSARAVVITTNAPPMNELVSDTFAVLVDAEASSAMGLGVTFKVRDDDLEKKIERTLTLPLATKAAMGALARLHFVRNEQEFRHRVTNAAREVIVGRR